MSGTENEAVQAALTALAQWTEPQYGDLQAVSAVRVAHIAYDAMRPIIAREVIAGVCRREGHKRLDTTLLDSLQLELRCGRCGEIWNEPRPAADTRPSWADGRVHLRPPTELSDKVPSWIIPTPDPPADATHVVLHDRQGNILAVGDLAKAQCPGCKRTIGREGCSSAKYRTPCFGIQPIPAPEPCPFDCDTGPLGRDQLIAHIAQQHPDARSVQSVLGGDDPRSTP